MANPLAMNDGKTVFSQLMSYVNAFHFNTCVDKYKGNYKVQSFSCREHLYALCFAQFTHRESLRDIEECLNSSKSNRYRSGFKSKISKTTLARANEKRDWRIYADMAHILIQEARVLYQKDNAFLEEINHAAYAIDSTVIRLCLALFPWAPFRKMSGAIKLHTQIDLHGSIPTFIQVTPGLVHDVHILDKILVEPGAFYVMDMAYVHFERLYRLHLQNAFFVSRAQKSLSYDVIIERKFNTRSGVRCDQSIRLRSFYPRKGYPELLRFVRYYDAESQKTYEFLSNNFKLTALQIASLYKQRWAVELFFRWIKLHLRIKNFYGTSFNAVSCQVWTAIITYLIVAIVKKRTQTSKSLYSLLRIFSVRLFEKTTINQLLMDLDEDEEPDSNPNQLKIFE